MQVEQDPVPHLIDCLARLIADHLHLFAADEQVTLSLHRLLVRLLRECPNCNYCNLVADALNDFHNNLSVHYEALKPDCRELLEVLVQRAVLPNAFFTSFQLLDENDPLRRFRQSAQDIVLVLCSSFPGVAFTASTLITIGLEGAPPLPVEESALTLFIGVVDAVEDHFMSFFSADDRYDENGSARSLQRTDIPREPFKTEFDDLLSLVFQHMGEFTKNPQLLVTALQVMFSFDNWTFSRGDYCRSLFDYLVQCIQHVPAALIPRLLCYICRLYESPCFAVDASHVETLMQLSGFIAGFHDSALFMAFVQTLSTSISSLPTDHAVAMYQRLLAPHMDAITALAAFLAESNPSNQSSEQRLSPQTMGTVVMNFKCLEAAFNGCVVEALANALAEAVLPPVKQCFDGLLRWLRRDASLDVTLLHEVCCTCSAVIRAAGQQLSAANCAVVTAVGCELVQNSLFVQDALTVMDSVAADSFSVLSQEQRFAFITSVQALLVWVVQARAARAEIECVKLILRIQYVFLKEDEKELLQMQSCLQEITQATLQLANQQIVEDDFIRLLLRNIALLATKYGPCVAPIYTDIVASCFTLACLNVPTRLHGLINGQLAQILLPAAPLVPVVEDAVQRLFAENRLPVLSRCSDAFKQKCVALLTSTRKSTALRSVVNNVISVLMGEMSEAVFASKYASF